MTKQERTKQLRRRYFWFFWILLCIICWVPVFNKYFFANEINYPTAGATRYLTEQINRPTVVVEKEKVEVVESAVKSEKPDIYCQKIYEVSEFKKLGKVKYGNFYYTWYSEKVLPGGGLKIPGRHHNNLGFVADINGYIVGASDSLPRHSIVDTPVGIKAKIYDCGPGLGIVDLYVYW